MRHFLVSRGMTTILGFAISVAVFSCSNPQGSEDPPDPPPPTPTTVERTVLLEEGTNSSCGPCATYNPDFDYFISQRSDKIVAVKYHAWWPSPYDPMYTANVTENEIRINYYSINGVPHAIVDGVDQAHPAGIETPYLSRKDVPSSVSISVTDQRVTADSIQADVTVTNLSALPTGTYRLRVFAIERHISYSSPPGSNGETDFYDVFRRAYPNTDGTAFPASEGVHTFTFKYRIEPGWAAAEIYSIVFVQDDQTKEVLNCAKSR